MKVKVPIKGTEKYKKHMAAMHANSVDLNAMRDAPKLDESVDTNTVVAQYTRATLDPDIIHGKKFVNK